MENVKNKRKIFKRIGAIVGAVILTIVAFSLPFFGNSGSKFSSKNMIASAVDYTESAGTAESSFIGNWLSYSYTLFRYNGSSYVSFDEAVYLTRFSVFKDSTGFSASVSLKADPTNTQYDYSWVISKVGSWANFYFSPSSNSDPPYVRISYYLSSASFDPTYISYCKVHTQYPAIDGRADVGVRIFDNSGNYIHFVCWRYYENLSYINGELVFYDEFVYFFKDSLGIDFNSGYNLGYGDGTEYGYSQGYSAGEVDGYSSGYKTGETVGYNNGYSVGLENGGKYTFFSLISAVIDAPIQAFMGLFNFELLGINLAGFFTGLLTLAFIITIVRLVMP